MEDLKLDWLSSVLRTEEEYRRYVPKVHRLCRIYTENGFRTVLYGTFDGECGAASGAEGGYGGEGCEVILRESGGCGAEIYVE